MGKAIRERAGVMVLGFALLLGCAGLFGRVGPAPAAGTPSSAIAHAE